MTKSDFWETFSSGRKCWKSPFLQIFIGLLSYISLFFHKKVLLIIIPTIKHVNKTDFWSRNCLKIAGTADFRRKTAFLEFFELYIIFFHEILHTDAKWQYLKCDGVRFSKKHAGNMPFLHIFIELFLYISCFLSDKRVIFNFSSLTQYFIHEFLLYSFARSFIRLLVRSFVFQYLFQFNVYVFSLCLTFIIR